MNLASMAKKDFDDLDWIDIRLEKENKRILS